MDVPRKASSELKALVLCAGKGTRLRPLTDSLPKALAPVANRPILFYALDQIQQTGIKEIGIVVSPENAAAIQRAVGDGSAWNARVIYITQTQPLGLAHAMLTGATFLDNSPFMMLLADNLIQGDLSRFVEQFCTGVCSAFILLKEVADPSHFGVAVLDRSGKVVRLVEKPKAPLSNLAMVGIYLFTPAIIHAARQIKPSPRGELEITDAIQWLVEHGEPIYSHLLRGWWLDTGQKEDLLEANRVILEESSSRTIKGNVDAASVLEGRVELAEGSEVSASIIRGPVSISSGCRIIGSEIGPHTSIGSGTVIQNSRLEYAILLENCLINTANVTDSILGAAVIVSGNPNQPPQRLFIGSCSRIET